MGKAGIQETDEAAGGGAVNALPEELDLSKYPTLRLLAAHNRAHVHERVDEVCSYCVVDRELRALVAATAERAREEGIGIAKRVVVDLANWSFRDTSFDYCPSNVLDCTSNLLGDVLAGLVTPRKPGYR